MNRASIYPALLLLAGCAGHGSILTILPPEDGGEVGGVAQISADGGELLYDKVGQSTVFTANFAPRSTTAKKIGELLNEIAGLMPPKPRVFTITFGINETRIPKEQRGTLDLIRNELASRPGAEIEVIGFTDSMGSAEFNDRISQMRALSVVNELQEIGFTVGPEDAVGRGERASRENGDPDEYPNALFNKVEIIIR